MLTIADPIDKDPNVFFAFYFNIKLTEQHVIFECPIVAKLRRDLCISNFMSESKAKGPIANVRVLRAYLGGDGSSKQTLMIRGKKLNKMIESWLTAIHEPSQ